GIARELKRALELYWSGRIREDQLEAVGQELRVRHVTAMASAGIDHVPSNDFSLYDHVLDTAVMVGAVPARYRAVEGALDRTVAMARGRQDLQRGLDLPALELTKWFDTNYHYIVPELEPGQRFERDPSKGLAAVSEARAAGVATRPVVVGPVT